MLNIDADMSTTETGAWQSFQGSDFLIAHTSSLRFQRALAKHQLPHRRKIAEGKLDPEVNRTIVCKAMAEAMLLDWKNVVNSKKEPVAYSKDEAFKLLSKNPEFRDFVSEFSMDITNFVNEEVAEAGNG